MAKPKASKKEKLVKSTYVPDKICYIQSGKYAGKSIPELMFADYRFLQNEFKLIINRLFNLSPNEQKKMRLDHYLKISKSYTGNKSELHKNLEFYIGRGENNTPDKPGRIICPYCHKRPVHCFAFINHRSYGIYINPDYIVCEDKACKDRFKIDVFRYSQKCLDDRMFKFSMFAPSSIYLDDKNYFRDYVPKMTKLFAKVYNLPEQITPQIAYNFFTSS